jgi:hypothetical protein
MRCQGALAFGSATRLCRVFFTLLPIVFLATFDSIECSSEELEDDEDDDDDDDMRFAQFIEQ